MKRKIYIIFSIFVLLVCSLFNGFKVSASSTHYDLTITDNALVYTFPDYHGSYSKEFILIDGVEIVSRLDNGLIINNELAIIDAYEYIWAWYFDLRVIGIEDYLLELKVYNLKATEYLGEQDFTMVKTLEIPVLSDQVNIAIDYDSTLETFVNIGFDQTNIKQFLKYNGLQPGYSALGNMLESYYNSGFSNGFNSGLNTQLAEPNWWVNMFNGIDAFLSINILPGFTIGAIFAIPLAFGVLKMILYFWRSGD